MPNISQLSESSSDDMDLVEELQFLISILKEIAYYYFTESIEQGLGNGSRVVTETGDVYDVWLENDQLKIQPAPPEEEDDFDGDHGPQTPPLLP